MGLFHHLRHIVGGAVEVGWVLQCDHATFLWDAPRQFKQAERSSDHAKSVVFCPAVIDYESRLFQINCPFDLNLRIELTKSGPASLIDADGERSGIVPKALNRLVMVSPKSQWRSPSRPILQIKTPYTFVADEMVYLNQMPPFLSYSKCRWPGVVIGGRFGVHVWPRPLSWAFEWHDTELNLIMRRGDPWFYVQFETRDPRRHIRLVEAEVTQELRSYFDGVNGVVNYINGTFSLFRTALQRRPKRLLRKVHR